MSTSPSSCPRVALIGISGYGRVYLNLVRECQAQGRLNLVAAVVINPEEEPEAMQWLESQQCRIYSDYEVMLREEAGRMDLCMVPTGIHWHTRMTVAALKAGANVMVEKPLCASLAEAEEIERTAREQNRFVAVGFQDYYEPGTQWLKQELSRGAIGKVESVRFLGLWPRPRQYFQRNNWAGKLAAQGAPVLDSPLSNAFAHFVMLSLFFAEPDPDQAATVELIEAELFRAHPIENFDTGVVRSRTANGTELWFGASHACSETVEPVIEIHGSAGKACWRYEEESWLQGADGVKQSQRLLSVDGARHYMMDAVLQLLADGQAKVCQPALAARHTAFIEALAGFAQVKSFDSEIIDWGADPDALTAVPLVEGLAPAMRAAHAEGSALSAQNVPWAVTP